MKFDTIKGHIVHVEYKFPFFLLFHSVNILFLACQSICCWLTQSMEVEEVSDQILRHQASLDMSECTFVQLLGGGGTTKAHISLCIRTV